MLLFPFLAWEEKRACLAGVWTQVLGNQGLPGALGANRNKEVAEAESAGQEQAAGKRPSGNPFPEELYTWKGAHFPPLCGSVSQQQPPWGSLLLGGGQLPS